MEVVDRLAGVAAAPAVERMAARMCLARVPLKQLLAEPPIPYEIDEVTRLVVDVQGVGTVHAVAGQDAEISVGHDVRLTVDLSRAAVLS